MSLKKQLFEDMKAAMKSGDKLTLGVIRLANAAIGQAEIQQREKQGSASLDDSAVIAVLTKMVKQHRDSVEQYQRAGREDLAQVEHQEITVIERYLPAQLNTEQIQAAINEAIAHIGAKSPADMAKIMGILKTQLAGQADMRDVSALVKSALSH